MKAPGKGKEGARIVPCLSKTEATAALTVKGKVK
jgi:hypothetical protein